VLVDHVRIPLSVVTPENISGTQAPDAPADITPTQPYALGDTTQAFAGQDNFVRHGSIEPAQGKDIMRQNQFPGSNPPRRSCKSFGGLDPVL
jgi:hypothetical protein